MSTVRATATFHYEHGTVAGGTELDADDPLAVVYAPLFEPVADGSVPRRGPGRPPGSRNRPKPEDPADG